MICECPVPSWRACWELYEEAIDSLDSSRVYVETDIPIDTEDAEAEEADYIAALERIGVE